MFTYTYIYITIMQKKFKFAKQVFDIKCYSTYGYSEVYLWLLHFLEQLVYTALHTYVQHFPLKFYYFYHVCISHEPYFLIWCVTECTMCESFAQLNSSISFCTYTMTYYVCHVHVVYIWDIYLSINCYRLLEFITCYYGHVQNITTAYNWYLFAHELM